jgi:sugar lactone lactonase YvrE
VKAPLNCYRFLLALLSLAFAASATAALKLEAVAMVPAPGQPEGIAVSPDDGSFWVTSNQEHAEVVVWHFAADGALLHTYPVAGHSKSAAHGANGVTLDGNGRVYVLDYDGARIVRLDPRSGDQQVYATVPDLPTCRSTRRRASSLTCEPSYRDRPAWPNWGTFDSEGNLYVSDLNQGYIWKVPPGGGEAVPWLSDEAFQSIFSLNGMQFDAEGRMNFVLTLSFDLRNRKTLFKGVVYQINVLADGSAGQLQMVSTFSIGDGMSIGQDGKIYLPVSNPLTNRIDVVDPTVGKVVQRLPRATEQFSGGVSLDTPASVAFRGNELLITNHALFSDNRIHWAVLKLDVGQPGLPLHYPLVP